MYYLNLKQVAKKLKVSVITIRRYIKSGKLIAKKIGRDYRVSDSDLNNLLNVPHEPKISKINAQKEKYKSKTIPIFPGLNFHVMETLAEMSFSIDSLNEIKDIVSKYDRTSLELLNKIEKNDTHNPSAAIAFLLIDDAIMNLQTRRRLFKDLIDRKGIILLPLPPHLSDSLLTITPKDMIFFSDGILPPHLKHSHYDDIDHIFSPELLDKTIDLKLLVTEGYIENQEIFFRRNVVSTIYGLSPNGLKEVYVHNIPHLPPHTEFIRFDKKNINMRISMI
jgi:excisionase family DNA binding protein